jgi:tetratricopeptide (TPR) repeat protein
LAVATASAQTWSQLGTLVFTPIDPNTTLAGRHAAAIPSRSTDPAEPAPAFVIARIRAATDAIEAERAMNGEISVGLVPLYMDLAGIYLDVSGYSDAILALEQAQQIVRRQQGLYSLDQADILEQIIEIESEFAPTEGSVREPDLRELVQRTPGDPRNVDILTSMAARQMEVVDYLLVNGLPPTLDLNVSMSLAPGMGRWGSPLTARAMAASILRQARANYGMALMEAKDGGRGGLSLLFELESSIIDTYYYELMNPQLRRSPRYGRPGGRLYGSGIRALETRLSNLQTFSGSPEAVADVLLEIADWYLMWGAFGTAMDKYEEALAYLRAQDIGDERVAAVLSPDTPVPLPANVANANVFSNLGDEHGYFDVEIEVNRFGGVRDLRITGWSPNASKSIERRLTRFIYQSRFRPRYENGEWQQSDRFGLRYEFSYATS